jgi:hypothetical protein
MILFGILLLVPTLASIVLRIPEVQTFMVKGSPVTFPKGSNRRSQ